VKEKETAIKEKKNRS